jgi:hypothetical protein
MTPVVATPCSNQSRRAAPSLAAAILACAFAAFVMPGATLAAKQPVPASLSDTESAAEDIVDHVLAHDRGSAVETATTLRRLARGPAATALAGAGVPSATVADLRRRADRVERLSHAAPFIDVALAANAVSQLMASLYAHFQDPVPAGILALDYLGREAEFRSIAHQPDKVAAAVAALERTWTPLRPKVVRAGGTREAANYGAHVAAMKRLVSSKPSKLQAEAVRGLELVDKLEDVFRR